MRFALALTVLLVVALPVELAVFDQLEEFVALLEVHRQVRRKDRGFHELHHAPVILRGEGLKFYLRVFVS